MPFQEGRQKLFSVKIWLKQPPQFFCPLSSYAAEFSASWQYILIKVQPWHLFLKDRALHGVPGPDLAGLVAKRKSARPTSEICRKMSENFADI
jgi:hypothetical protein